MTRNLAAVKDAWRNPDEGDDVTESDVAVLRQRFDALSAGARSWIAELVKRAKQNQCGFHLSECHTVRRYEIYRGLVLLAEHGDCDDGDVRVLVASVMQSDVPHWPSIHPGHAVGACDWAEATAFARLADRYVNGQVAGVVRDGELYVEAA